MELSQLVRQSFLIRGSECYLIASIVVHCTLE